MIKENFGTFVFFDIETTGLPDHEFNKTKITELALVACSKVELQKYVKGTVPRVVHKLTVCVNPRKMISPDSSKITGKRNCSHSSLIANKSSLVCRSRQL